MAFKIKKILQDLSNVFLPQMIPMFFLYFKTIDVCATDNLRSGSAKMILFCAFLLLLHLVKKTLYYLLTFPRISRENAPYRGIFLQVVKKESGNDKNSLVKKLFVNKCTTITQFDRNLHRLFVRYYYLHIYLLN